MLAQIRLAELIGALSHALDLTGGQIAGHCIRTAHIGTAAAWACRKRRCTISFTP